MKKLLLLIVFSMIYADPPNWEDSPWEYEYTASLVGVVFYNGEQMADDGDLFAGFDEDGNVRGLGIALFVPFGPYTNSILWEFTLRSNEELGDILSFQYYDASQDAILDIVETYTFIADEISGSLVNPLEFTAVFLEDEDGCTDSTASNYNPEANIDDGSCEYEECLFEDLDGDSFDDISFIAGSSTGDVNGDGSLNIVDIVFSIDMILNAVWPD